MSRKAIVAGHICLDITPVFDAAHSVPQLGDLLVPGRLLHVEQADVHTGGSVANTGLGMKILGADVCLMGKVGNDAFGDMIRGLLRHYKADADLLVDKNSSTSYSIILAVPGIDRVFLHNPGANDTFTSSDVTNEALRDASLFHFGYPPLMKRMYENDGEQLCRLFARVKAQNIATSLDLAAVDAASEAGRADWGKILTRILPDTDFFEPSYEELCFMLDRPKYEALLKKAKGGDITSVLDMNADVKPLADMLMGMGCKVVLIKCGAPGMYWRTSNLATMQKVGSRLELDSAVWADKCGFEESYLADTVLSATGAGDTSIAAFLTVMLNGGPPEQCVRLAAATGACCVQAYDAISGLKPLPELEKKIAGGWKKYHSDKGE